MNSTLRAALTRSLMIAALAFVAAAGAAYLADGNLQHALVAGAGAAIATVMARGGVEGLYDANRASIGNVKPSDVQALVKSLEVPTP